VISPPAFLDLGRFEMAFPDSLLARAGRMNGLTQLPLWMSESVKQCLVEQWRLF